LKNKKLIGVGIFILLVLIIICVKYAMDNNSLDGSLDDTYIGTLKDVTVATGGGKEDFLADEDVQNILKKKYGLNVTYDSWSNGKLILNPLVR
jgi:hypothetical protein